MVAKKKLTLRKRDSVVYTIKAGEDIIWEGKDIHKKYPVLKAANRDKNLRVSWKTVKEFSSA